MKKSLFVIFLLSMLLVGCDPVSPATASIVDSPTTILPSASFTVIPATATEVPPTETPTEIPPTPTETEVPPTATPQMTATPNFYNFAEFTPEPATINQANWNGVNFKLAKIEYTLKMTPLDPSQKPIAMGQGKKTANAYFITDNEDIFDVVMKDIMRDIFECDLF